MMVEKFTNLCYNQTESTKCVTNESVEITLDNNVKMKTRLVDCVGYLVDSATGILDGDEERMVKTPWSNEEMPFREAAEIGTEKVIKDHSTIGIVVTTDGSITDIEREDYVDAETRVISELKGLDKPFVVLLNSTHPEREETIELAKSMSERYDASVMPIDIANMTEKDLGEVFSRALDEFPVTEIGFKLPDWFSSLPVDHWFKQDVISIVKNNFDSDYSLRQISELVEKINSENEIFENVKIERQNVEDGSIKIKMDVMPKVFYKIISEESGFEVEKDSDIFNLMRDYSKTKTEYDKIAMALEEVKIKGYGIVTPQMSELTLEEPEIVKQGNKYGVKLKASAPSIHMIRADIETEVSAIVGSEKQSEDLVKYLLSEFETDPKKIWESNIFGKSLHELVNEGLHNKLYRMPDEAQMKLQETLQKIINEGSGGLICIIL